MTPLYLPSTLANWMHLGKPTRPATMVLQLPLRYGWLHPSSAKLPSEISAVVTFVSGQASGALARSALRPGHLHPIQNLKPYSDFGYIAAVTRKARGSPLPSVTRWMVLPLPLQP